MNIHALSVYLSIFLYFYIIMSVYHSLSLHRSIYLMSVCLSVRQMLLLSIFLFMSLSTSLSISSFHTLINGANLLLVPRVTDLSLLSDHLRYPQGLGLTHRREERGGGREGKRECGGKVEGEGRGKGRINRRREDDRRECEGRERRRRGRK